MTDNTSLLPARLRAAVPELYSTEQEDDPCVQAKFFTPWAHWTWFVLEFDGEDTLFGLVSGHEVELGYFSLTELESLEGPGGLRIERDLHFTPKPLSAVRNEVDRLRGGRGSSTTQENRPVYGHDGGGEAEATRAADPLVWPAIRMLETRLASSWCRAVGEPVTAPEQAAFLLRELIGSADREHFVALLLNARHQVTHAHVVSVGTLQSAQVHPREVFKAALLANAAAVIVGHNHPSGDVQPSREDAVLLERLQEAGDLLGIPVLDALTVGPQAIYYSASSERDHRLPRVGLGRQPSTDPGGPGPHS